MSEPGGPTEDHLIDRQVLSETRMQLGVPADQISDDQVRGTLAYQSAMLSAEMARLVRTVRAALPRPLRRLLDT